MLAGDTLARLRFRESSDGSSADYRSLDLTEAKPVCAPTGGRLLTDRFAAALRDAVEAHADDVRKGTTIPYISHVLSVCALVPEHGGGADEAIAALLHDALEDAPTVEEMAARRAHIRDRFGEQVLSIVTECSDTDRTPKPPWRERKVHHLARLHDRATLWACRVIAANKRHNARALVSDYRQHGENLWTRFNADPEDTLWYYRSIVRVLRRRSSGPLVEEPACAVADLMRLADETVAR
jgi:(p)ppGpp synthase/HD superfamily hydrolase